MSKRRWVTGDALMTLLALRPLQVGDEVKIRTKQYRYCNTEGLWRRQALVIVDDDGPDKPPRWFAALANAEDSCRGGMVYFDDTDVTHWRLPRGKQ